MRGVKGSCLIGGVSVSLLRGGEIYWNSLVGGIPWNSTTVAASVGFSLSKLRELQIAETSRDRFCLLC